MSTFPKKQNDEESVVLIISPLFWWMKALSVVDVLSYFTVIDALLLVWNVVLNAVAVNEVNNIEGMCDVCLLSGSGSGERVRGCKGRRFC